MAERDFLDEMIEKRAARNPEFLTLLEVARRDRELLRDPRVAADEDENWLHTEPSRRHDQG